MFPSHDADRVSLNSGLALIRRDASRDVFRVGFVIFLGPSGAGVLTSLPSCTGMRPQLTAFVSFSRHHT